MYDESDRAHPDDLDAVGARLRASRDELTGMELDTVRQRALRAAARNTRSRRSTFMKSRLAVTAMLVLGMLFSTAGAGLAVTGVTGSDTPSSVQYKQDDDSQQVLGEVGDVGEATEPTDSDAAPSAPAATPTEPQEAGGELPFTGFLAIPILIGGVALLTSGLILRRRTGERDDVS
jgi:hypothetical protein